MDISYVVLNTLSNQGPVHVFLAMWQGQRVIAKHLMAPNDTYAERMAREALVAHRLSHPKIVPLVHVAPEGDILFYKYIEGVSLAEILYREQLGCYRALEIAWEVLQALSYAHHQGVIHCDIKPGNIIVQPNGNIMLTDFGFAKDLTLSAITQPNTLFGTPQYMAPEPFLGKRSDLRSDLYSLGATLMHMLTGMPPYKGENFRVLLTKTSRPQQTLPDSARPVAPLLEKALALDVEARYQSAYEMAQDLAKAMTHIGL